MTRGKGQKSGHCSGSEQLGACLRPNFKLGDITWVKLDKTWWPAQVVDEEHFSASSEKKRDNILVRIYGTCDCLYMDPFACLPEYDMLMKEGCRTIKEMFQKLFDQDLQVSSKVKSGRQLKLKGPDNSHSAPKSKRQKKDNTKQNHDFLFPCTEASTTKVENHGVWQSTHLSANEQAASEVNAMGSGSCADTKQGRTKEIKKAEVKMKHSTVQKGHLRRPIQAGNIASDATIRVMVRDILSNRKQPNDVNSESKIIQKEDVNLKKGKKNQSAAKSRARNISKHKKDANGEPCHPSICASGGDSARRFKVMQSLALVAPPGSPFSRTELSRAA